MTLAKFLIENSKKIKILPFLAVQQVPIFPQRLSLSGPSWQFFSIK
jgi:hypothetical protein